MSIDEGDARGNKPCDVLLQRWRSKELGELFQTLDDLHLASRWDDGHYGLGRFPHRRVRGQFKLDPRSAPPGLPSNFYSQEYLEGLSDFELEALDVKPPVKWSLSLAMRR
jgi:hypothetical protein